MKRNCKRWVGILSLVLVVAFVMGIIPANELRADMKHMESIIALHYLFLMRNSPRG